MSIRKAAGLLLYMPLLLLAQTPVVETASFEAVQRDAAQMFEAGRAEDAEAQYREFLAFPNLAVPDEIAACVALITLLVDRAHDELAGKEEFHQQSKLLLERGLPLARQNGDHLAIAEMLRLSWLIQFQQNQLDGSARLLLDALEELELAGASDREKSAIYGHLSYTFILAGEFERAIAYQRHNVVRSMQDGDPEQQSVDLYVIGDTYLKLGELDVAERYFQQALAPHKDDRSRDYYEDITKLATIMRLKGDAPGALEIHLDVARFFRDNGGYREVPAEIEVARDYLALNDLQSAKLYAGQALNDRRAFTEQKLDASLLLMKLSQLTHRDEETLKWISRIETLLRESFEATGSEYIHPLRQIEFARQAIELFLKLRDRDRVFSFGARGLEVYQHIESGLSTSGSSHLAWTASTEPFISEYIAALYALDRSRILPVLESTYSRSLMAGMSSQEKKSPPVADDLLRLEEYLSAENDVIDAVSDYEQEPVERNRIRLEQARNRSDHARERYLLTNLDSFGPANSHQPEVAADQIKVHADDLVLRFYVSDKISFVLGKDQASESYFDLPGKTEIMDLVEQARMAMNVIGTDEKSQELTALAALLPVHLLRNETYRRVVIIPDDVTHEIPFSAIDLGSGTEPYQPLGLSKEVLRTYSMTEYYRAVRSTEIGLENHDSRIVIFADPVFEPQIAAQSGDAEFRNWAQTLERLPNTANEARFIAELYPKDRVTTYLGSQATSAALLAQSTRKAAVLHIATHGYFNPETPDIVGIATSSIDANGHAQRGFLSLSELLSQPFSSRLIVISGCETMLGRSYGGLGVRSLAQGFIAQGAGATLGTLWRIPDRATAEFMQVFYRALLNENGNASRALFQVRQEMIHSRKFNQPSFWAAFSLTSSNRQVDLQVFE